MSYKDYAYLANSSDEYIDVYNPENAVTYRIYENKGYDTSSGNRYHIAFIVTENGLSIYPTGYRFGYKIPMNPREHEKEDIYELSGNKTINKIVEEYYNRQNKSFNLNNEISHTNKGRKAYTGKVNQNFTIETRLKEILIENDMKLSPTINIALKEYLEKLGLIKLNNEEGKYLWRKQ